MHFFKFKLLVLLFPLIIFQNRLNAQYHSIRADVFPGVFVSNKILRVMYEYSRHNNFSVGLVLEGGRYGQAGSSPGIFFKEIYGVRGFGLMPQFRFYPLRKKRPAPFGFFIGSHFKYNWIEEVYNELDVHVKTHANIFLAGGHLGYKFFIGIVDIEVLSGLGISGGHFEKSNERHLIPAFYRSSARQLLPSYRLELSLGVHFPKFKKETVSL